MRKTGGAATASALPQTKADATTQVEFDIPLGALGGLGQTERQLQPTLRRGNRRDFCEPPLPVAKSGNNQAFSPTEYLLHQTTLMLLGDQLLPLVAATTLT